MWTAEFVDEYRLLCTFPTMLVLWDFQVEGNPGKFTFRLEEGVHVSNILRSYELFDTKPFCVDHEAGIVVLEVQGKPFNALVIPTSIFVDSKTLWKIGSLGRLWSKIHSTGAVKWEDWGCFVTKLFTRQDNYFTFHAHVLYLVPDHWWDAGKHRTSVTSYVDDFSRYSRRAVQDHENRSCDRAQGADCKWDRCQIECDDGLRPQPLAVTRYGRFDLDTPYDARKLYPTENGLLVIEVRIPVIAKRIRVLIQFIIQPGADTARFLGFDIDP